MLDARAMGHITSPLTHPDEKGGKTKLLADFYRCINMLIVTVLVAELEMKRTNLTLLILRWREYFLSFGEMTRSKQDGANTCEMIV